MDHLRMGIHLRGYAQKDPKQEYKREAFEMFTNLLEGVKQEVISIVSRVQVRSEEEVRMMEDQARQAQEMQFQHAQAATLLADEEENAPQLPSVGGEAGWTPEPPKPFKRDIPKVGRNDPCPCGSGMKYKQCHGKLDA